MYTSRCSLFVAAMLLSLGYSKAEAQKLVPLSRFNPYVNIEKESYRQVLAQHPGRITVKFVNGSRVRFQKGIFSFDERSLDAQDHSRLSRVFARVEDVRASLAEVTDVLSGFAVKSVARTFPGNEPDTERRLKALEEKSGEELADLNLFFNVVVDDRDSRDLLAALNAADVVELAYIEPDIQNAFADIAPTTPNFENQQGYVGNAPLGVDARFGWSRTGGDGAGARIIDVEYSWNLTHEDLQTVTPVLGTNQPLGVGTNSQANRNHGTAVLGILFGEANAFGIRGIAEGATVGISSSWLAPVPPSTQDSIDVVTAITNAANSLGANGVILIEQQAAGPEHASFCGCVEVLSPPPGQPVVNCPRFVPVEYSLAVYNAIRTATLAGVHVVEAAGNGAADLDSAPYGTLFQRTSRDSGAILVGSGVPGSRAPTCSTTFGSRVDVQGWGSAIVTTGDGDQWNAGADQNQWYAASFGGTSGASAITAGVVTDIVGYQLAHSQPPFSTGSMRTNLVTLGTPQPTPVTRQIGPQPNLRRVIGEYLPPVASGYFSAGFISSTRTAVMGASDGPVNRFGFREITPTGTTASWTSFPLYQLPPGAPISDVLYRSTGQNWAFSVTDTGAIVQMVAQITGWGVSSVVAPAGSATPGSHIAAIKSATSEMALFYVTPTGVVRALVYNYSTWTGINLSPSGYAPPGAKITAHMRAGALDAYFINSNGALAGVSRGIFGWSTAATASANGIAQPGSAVAAGYVGGTSNIFHIGNDGAVKVWADSGFGWIGPGNLTSASAMPSTGDLWAANWNGTNRIEVFFVGNNQTLTALTSDGLGVWNTVAIQAEAGIPGAVVRAATEGAVTQLDVFVNGHQGLMKAVTTNGTTWSSAVALP